MAKLRVLVAEDHALMREAVRIALEEAEGIEVVGEAENGSQVIPLVGRTQPDLVLLDIEMPETDGLTCLDLLRKRYPDVKVVMLSASDEREKIETALRRGATGYVIKTVQAADLAFAVRNAVEGTVVTALPVTRTEAQIATDAGLSKKELSVLTAVAHGRSNKQIARELWVTEQTVKFHLGNIYRKLGVANRTEAARYAYEHGLVENPVYERV